MYTDDIDTARGIAGLMGKKEIYAKIAGKFTAPKDTKAEELRQFFAAGDFKRLGIEFHGLKSSSAALGSTALPPLAMELEIAVRDENNDLVRQKFEQFVEQYLATCDALDAAVAAL